MFVLSQGKDVFKEIKKNPLFPSFPPFDYFATNFEIPIS